MSYTFYVFLYCFVLFLLMLFKGGKSKYEVYLLLVLPILIYVHSFLDPNTIVDLPIYRESFADVRLTNVFKIKKKIEKLPEYKNSNELDEIEHNKKVRALLEKSKWLK